MQIQELMNQARDAMTVRRVFGDPYERDGTTVIPVASVMGGAGGGEEGGPAPDGADATQGSTRWGGSGGGFGVRATPAGVYVIKGGDVRWVPALDVGRIVLIGQLVAIVFLLTVRSIAGSRR